MQRSEVKPNNSLHASAKNPHKTGSIFISVVRENKNLFLETFPKSKEFSAQLKRRTEEEPDLSVFVPEENRTIQDRWNMFSSSLWCFLGFC